MTRVVRTLLLAGLLPLLLPAASLAEAAGSPVQEVQAPRRVLLDVPYLTQTEALCGGAAVAMVQRYWGDKDILPLDYASEVTRDGGQSGIKTDALVRAVGQRGWQALVLRTFDQTLEAGRPVIALLEERPGAFHYVVIVGATKDAVVVHDPARAPFRVLTRSDFDRRLAASGGWLLLILPRTSEKVRTPSTGTLPSAPTTAPAQSDASSDAMCRSLVSAHVDLARAGDLATAEDGFRAATSLCAGDPSAWRELAGLRFVQSRWSEVTPLASRAVELDPGDAHAWRLLATARFLQDDLAGALEAWNQIREPKTDVVTVEGLDRTRHGVVVDLLDLEPRTMLTERALGRARRRLALLPSASDTKLTYVPSERGTAAINAWVKERSLYPDSWASFMTIGARAIMSDELRVDIASPTGGGEVWSGAYRWSGPRRRVMGQLETPIPHVPGVVTMSGFWERQTYFDPRRGEQTIESRTRYAVGVIDWISRSVRWGLGGAMDHITGDRHFSVDGGLDVRLADDHVSLLTSISVWTPGAVRGAFSAGDVTLAWRSATEPVRWLWTTEIGVAGASHRAPLAVWPGGHTSTERGGTLRAHPLREGDIITGEVFGRRLAYASIGTEQLVRTTPFGRVSVTEFVDLGQAWRRLGGRPPSPLEVDIGIGLRVAGSKAGGTVRLDFAHGLRDGRNKVSAGWVRAWPGR